MSALGAERFDADLEEFAEALTRSLGEEDQESLDEQSPEETRRRLKALPPLHREFLDRLTWCYLRAVEHSEEEHLLESALRAACEARGVLTFNVVDVVRSVAALMPMKRRPE